MLKCRQLGSFPTTKLGNQTGFSNWKQKAVTFLLGCEFFSHTCLTLKFTTNCYLEIKFHFNVLKNTNEDAAETSAK